MTVHDICIMNIEINEWMFWIIWVYKSRGDIPHLIFPTPMFSSKTGVFNKTILSLVENLIDLWCGPMRARFDENTGVGLKTYV